MPTPNLSRRDEKGSTSTPSLVLEPHPAAMLFPMMSNEELSTLAEDIRQNGLLEPVVLYHGQVLDGRNRLAACELANVEPHFREVDGDVPSPTLYVFSKNLQRRHLTTSQRAAIAAEIVPLLQAESERRMLAHLKQNQSLIPLGSNDPSGAKGKSTEIAAKEAQVGEATVRRAAEVKRVNPELFEQVKRGEIAVNTAKDLLPKSATQSQPKKKRLNEDHQRKLAHGQKERMVKALSTMNGLMRGLGEYLDLDKTFAVCTDEERQAWKEMALDIAKRLRAFAAKF